MLSLFCQLIHAKAHGAVSAMCLMMEFFLDHFFAGAFALIFEFALIFPVLLWMTIDPGSPEFLMWVLAASIASFWVL